MQIISTYNTKAECAQMCDENVCFALIKEDKLELLLSRATLQSPVEERVGGGD